MAFELDGATAEAAKLALQIGSATADAISFAADLGEELPVISPVLKFVDRCSRRGRVSRVLKASSDREEIARLSARVDQLSGDSSLAGVASVVSFSLPLYSASLGLVVITCDTGRSAGSVNYCCTNQRKQPCTLLLRLERVAIEEGVLQCLSRSMSQQNR